jgi:predicted metal-dependent RNase
MIFQDLNPHGGIGANCTYGKIGPFQFAIDSGLHPKHAGNESLPRHDRIPPGELDFILLTHCHLFFPGFILRPLFSSATPAPF